MRRKPPYFIRMHIADYHRDTDDLSMLQHGAYWLLMLHYYNRAEPIPNDLERIYRRVHAYSSEERGAVRFVLEEFFRLEGPVWRHKRIDFELERWAEQSEKQARKARDRWNHDSEENSNKNNEGDNAAAEPQQSQCNANHRTIEPQNHRTSEPPSNTMSASQAKTDSAREKAKQREQQAKTLLAFLNVKRVEIIGSKIRGFQPVEANLKPILGRLRDGHSIEDCKKVIVNRTLAWKERPEMHEHLNPETLFRPKNFAKYLANLPKMESGNVG